MFKIQSGAFRLFRVAGITVYLHWMWFLLAFFQITRERLGRFEYSPEARFWWRAAEYLTLFAIVLLHEFGHALACRSVGGTVDRIVLWPLGGVAFVNPPPRPGAVLWSIAAGPLVNVVLVPVTFGLMRLGGALGGAESLQNLQHYFDMIWIINIWLLIFNLLPIYPLDGGQILQALLWFVIGRGASLMVVSVLGLVGGVGLGLVFFAVGLLSEGPRDPLSFSVLGIMIVFVVLQSLAGFRSARILLDFANASRRRDLACPSCGAPPPQGHYWICNRCRDRFDMFAAPTLCPSCGQMFAEAMCPECHRSTPVAEWFPAVTAADGGLRDVPGEPL